MSPPKVGCGIVVSVVPFAASTCFASGEEVAVWHTVDAYPDGPRQAVSFVDVPSKLMFATVSVGFLGTVRTKNLRLLWSLIWSLRNGKLVLEGTVC